MIGKKRKKSESEKRGIRERNKFVRRSRPKPLQEKCIPGYGSLIQDEDGYLDFSDYSLECEHCGAQHFFFERLSTSTKDKHVLPNLCCGKGKYKPEILDPPKELQDLFTGNSADSRHFRKHIRSYNNAFSLASVQANWVSRGLGSSSWNPTFTVQGKMYHLLGAMNPPDNVHPRYASLYVYDTENSTANRKRFHPNLKENVLTSIYSLDVFLKMLIWLYMHINLRLMSMTGNTTFLKNQKLLS